MTSCRGIATPKRKYKLKSIKLCLITPVLRFLVSLIVLLGFTGARAAVGDEFIQPGIKYNLKFQVLTEEEGNYTCAVMGFETDPTENVALDEIPEQVYYKGHSYTVTEIGRNAFEGKTCITSVSLPKTIKKIGFFALSKNSYSSITLP